MDYNKDGKSLSEVFRELELSKDKQVDDYKKSLRTDERDEVRPFFAHVRQRTKKDNIKLVVIVAIVITTFSMLSSNYILAVDLDTDEAPKDPIGTFEKNDDIVNVYKIVSNNISTTYQKEIVDVDEDIQFETQRNNNKDMPKDEEKIIQEGEIGEQIVTYVRSYENNEITDEKAIGKDVIKEPVTEIIEVRNI